MIKPVKFSSSVKKACFAIALLVGASQSIAAEGVKTIKSQLNFEQSVQKLEATLKAKGMTIFAVVDHAKGAESVSIDLLPTTLFIFGNPKAGSPLMKCEQSIALDLPQKMLISENSEGEVFVSYNAPDYIASRHELSGCEKNLMVITNALKGIANKAAGLNQ